MLAFGSQLFSHLLPRCCWECFSSLLGVLRYFSFNVSSITVQTSMTISPMVVFPTRNWNDNDWKLSPVARYLRVNAKRSQGGIEFRIGVSFFYTEGPMMFNSSLNLRWGILIYSANPPESSESNYRVRLNLNMDIADSISFYFNFAKGHYFVLRIKQHFLDKARFFKINTVNSAIVDRR